MRKELKGLDEWITRDDRVELPTKVWWVDGLECIGSYEDSESAIKCVLEYGTPEMKEYPEDYIYEGEEE